MSAYDQWDNSYVCGYTHADVIEWMRKNKLLAWMHEAGLDTDDIGISLFESLLADAFNEAKAFGTRLSFEHVAQKWRQELKNPRVLYAYLPSQQLKDALRAHGIMPTRHNCAVVNELRGLPQFDGDVGAAIRRLLEAGRFDLHWELNDDEGYVWCMPTEKPERFVFAACVTTRNGWYVPYVSTVDLDELDLAHLSAEAGELLDGGEPRNRELAEVAFEDELAELASESDMSRTFESRRDAMDWIDREVEEYTWRVLSPEAAERMAERESGNRPFVR